MRPALLLAALSLTAAAPPPTHVIPEVIVAYDRNHVVETIVANGAALILPVPTALSKPTLRMVRTAAINRLTAATAPRLIQTADPDPCFPHPPRTPPKPIVGPPVPLPTTSAPDSTVAILPAADTNALNRFLPTLQPPTPALSALLTKAQRQNLSLLAIRPTPNATWAVQVTYDSANALLPLNAAVRPGGSAEMLILALTSKGSLSPTAGPAPVPSGSTVPEYIAGDFDRFYAAMLSHQPRQQSGISVFQEFAGPVLQAAPSQADLTGLGASWPSLEVARLRIRSDAGAPLPPLGPGQAVPAFQAVYVTRIAWKGQYTLACSAGFDYRHSLTARWTTEIASLASLTGWDPVAIRAAMVAHWQATREPSN